MAESGGAQDQEALTPMGKRRRQLLITGGAALAATGGLHVLNQLPFLKATLEAYGSREIGKQPNPPSLERAVSAEREYDRIMRLYSKYFHETERYFWSSDFQTYFHSLERMAMIYYEEEKKPEQPNCHAETFTEYLERFLDSAYEMCHTLNVDFALFVLFSVRAMGVADPSRTVDDIEISQKQLLVTAADRFIGADGHIPASVSASHVDKSEFDKMRARIGKKINEKIPLPLGQAARIDGPLTLGQYDLETLHFSRAILGRPTSHEFLKARHPQVETAFAELNTQHDELEKRKKAATEYIEAHLDEILPLIVGFLGPENGAHLATIGIGETPDDWHRTHASIPYAHILKEGNLHLSATNTQLFYRGELPQDRPEIKIRGRALLCDELLNPKFVPYLRLLARLAGRDEEVLDRLCKLRDAILESEEDTLVAERLADASVGPLERDSEYQLLSTVSLLGHLQETIEKHDGYAAPPYDRNNFAYMAYRMKMMMDWPPPFLLSGRFGDIPLTKADTWGCVTERHLTNLDAIVNAFAASGIPLNPETDMSRCLFILKAFSSLNPNPFMCDPDTYRHLASQMYTYMIEPNGGPQWILRDYIKPDQLEAITIEHRDLVNGVMPVYEIEEGDFHAQWDRTVARIEQEVPEGGYASIVLINSMHPDRTLVLPRGRHIVIRGFSATLTFSRDVTCAFESHPGGGPAHLWLNDIYIAVDHQKPDATFKIVRFDGKGEGFLYMQGVRTVDRVDESDARINTSIECRNAPGVYMDSCVWRGERHLSIHGAQYVSIQACTFLPVCGDLAPIQMTGTKPSRFDTIIGFAPLNIFTSNIQGFSTAAIETDAPRINVNSGRWDLPRLVDFVGDHHMPEIHILGLSLNQPPEVSEDYAIHMSGGYINTDPKALRKQLLTLQRLVDAYGENVFTRYGNTLWRPLITTPAQEEMFDGLEGQFLQVKEKPSWKAYVPQLGTG